MSLACRPIGENPNCYIVFPFFTEYIVRAAKHSSIFYQDSGLFSRLAHTTLLKCFTPFQMAARRTPCPFAMRALTFYKQYPAVLPPNDDPNPNFRANNLGHNLQNIGFSARIRTIILGVPLCGTITSMKKSGFVAIVGRSNVGKSTLLNSLVGSKIAITTPKPQTTRRPVQGIISDELGQAVVVDTPGLMQKARDPLTQKLTGWIRDALRDIDCILYVADPTRAIGDEEKAALRLIAGSDKPKLLVINKIDDKTSRNYLDFYRDLAKDFTAYVEASAMTGKNTDLVKRWIFEQLPEGEFHYPEFQLTDMSNEEWMAELIREKLFLRLREEVPYSTHVIVEELSERENGMMYVKAVVYTTSDRYRRMIIGVGARGIREIGQSTRRELEAVTNKKFFLDLSVDVDPNWVDRLE